jgi:hypothetical protein
MAANTAADDARLSANAGPRSRLLTGPETSSSRRDGRAIVVSVWKWRQNDCRSRPANASSESSAVVVSEGRFATRKGSPARTRRSSSRRHELASRYMPSRAGKIRQLSPRLQPAFIHPCEPAARAQSAGTSLPPSSESRAPMRPSVGCDTSLPANNASPCLNATARSSRPRGAWEKTSPT